MIVTANQFWTDFSDALQKARRKGYGEKWTDGMYNTLHLVQLRHRVWCQCLRHANRPDGGVGERLLIDLLWFPQATGHRLPDEAEWVAPCVAIEHENGYSDVHRSVDHWKVSQVAAPLRVFIGYTNAADEIARAATVLQTREPRWNAVPGGESLIVLGHAEMDYPCFRAWWAKQGTSEWTALSSGVCGHE